MSQFLRDFSSPKSLRPGSQHIYHRTYLVLSRSSQAHPCLDLRPRCSQMASFVIRKQTEDNVMSNKGYFSTKYSYREPVTEAEGEGAFPPHEIGLRIFEMPYNG